MAGGTFASNVVGGLVNGAIDSETTRLLGGRGANSRQITEDAFGNALGNWAGQKLGAAIDQELADSKRAENEQAAQRAYSSGRDPILLGAQLYALQKERDHDMYGTTFGIDSEETAQGFGGGSPSSADGLGGGGSNPAPSFAGTEDTASLQQLYAGIPSVDVRLPSFTNNPEWTTNQLAQLNVDEGWMSKAYALAMTGDIQDPESLQAANQAMIAAANSGGAKGWGYDSQLIAAANDKWNVAIARNHLNVELWPTVTVSNASPDEIAFQQSLAQAAENQQAQLDAVRVNAERVGMAHAQQQLQTLIHDKIQSEGRAFMGLQGQIFFAASTAGVASALPVLGTAYEGSRVGSLISFAGATRGGSAATSALINAGSQLLSGDPFRWSGVVQAGVAGYLGPGGGVGWNVTVNAVTGGAATEFDNYYYGEDKSVLLSSVTSGAGGGLGFKTGNVVTARLDGSIANQSKYFSSAVYGNVVGSITSETVNRGVDWLQKHGHQ